MKAVVVVAGLWTRMLPITKTIPKEMLPVWDKPVIHYIVEDLASAGVEDIIMITSKNKSAMEDYFRDSPELEALLSSKWKTELLELINKPKTLARYTFVKQDEQLGTAHAVNQARSILESEDHFLVIFGDMVFPPRMYDAMLAKHKETWAAILTANHVAREDVYKYGVMALDGDRIIQIVEKPRVEDAPSTLIWNGVALLPKEIFPYIDIILWQRQEWHEAFLPEAIWLMLKDRDVRVLEVAPFRDIGSPELLLKANAYLYEHGKLFD